MFPAISIVCAGRRRVAVDRLRHYSARAQCADGGQRLIIRQVPVLTVLTAYYATRRFITAFTRSTS
jgi:hypothetical protein